MNKNRLIFYIVFMVFHLVTFFFTLYVDSQRENFQFLLKMQSNIPMLKYGAMLGLVLIGTDFVWTFLSNRTAETEKKQLNSEINSLKAKLFDLQETAKEVRSAPKADSSEKNS